MSPWWIKDVEDGTKACELEEVRMNNPKILENFMFFVLWFIQ